jgi:hypothetical protein
LEQSSQLMVDLCERKMKFGKKKVKKQVEESLRE